MCWVTKFILVGTDFVVECPGDGFGGQIYVLLLFLMTSGNRVSRKLSR